MVLSTPIPREIKKAYPDSFVSVLVRKYTRDIYLHNPYVDEIILFDGEDENYPKSFWQLVEEIKRFKFTHAFMLLPNERLNWILFFSCIPTRIGVGHKLYQFLSFSKFVDRKKYIPLRHEADYCLDMIRKIGIEPQSIAPEIFLTSDEIKKRDDLKKRFAPNGETLIGVNTTSGKSSPNLTIDEYRKLIVRLSKESNIRVVVTDNNTPSEIKNIERVIYPNNGLSLRESIINFSALDILVSASTGPMHICAALKVPTISMFCPLPACSPKLWGPIGNKSEIILPEENYCSTVCPGDPHICDFSGKGGIDAEKVFEKVKSFINR
ncbi:MAG: glycosyltransferase family 9 protein [Ignavibacteriaceae bacterium]|nr:glycosyltransferase family 9 protein [Ignavibacteriaceae bacterium]